MKNLGIKHLKSYSFRKIEKLQNKRFHGVAKYLLPHVPFYSHLFKKLHLNPAKLKKIEDWGKLGLPLVKKSYFRLHPREFILQGKPKQLANDYLKFVSHCSKSDLLSLVYHKEPINTHISAFFRPTMLIFSGGLSMRECG